MYTMIAITLAALLTSGAALSLSPPRPHQALFDALGPFASEVLSQSARTDPLPPGSNPAALFDQYVKGLAACTGVTALTVVVQVNHTVVYKNAIGLRDLESQAPADNNTAFGIGSCTKAFTAALVAMAVDRQAMAWTDKVSKYIPGFTYVRWAAWCVCGRPPVCAPLLAAWRTPSPTQTCAVAVLSVAVHTVRSHRWRPAQVTLADLGAHKVCMPRNDLVFLSGL